MWLLAAPQAFAASKNLAIALLRRQGWINIAAAIRSYAGRPACAVGLVASAGVTWGNDPGHSKC